MATRIDTPPPLCYNRRRGDLYMQMKSKKPQNKVVLQRYNIVVKANALIQNSRFSLSTQQQKILMYIISHIEPYDNEFKTVSFSTVDFCKTCGIETKSDIYEIVKRQIKDIADKSLWIENEEGKETLLRWIEKPYINKHSGIIEIKLDDDMKPYLLQLKEKFTEYTLIYTLNFKSKYSIRLYEYLKSIHYKKLCEYEQTLTIEKFMQLLDSPYKNFKDFHIRVLKAAQKEINELSDIIFDYELHMQGRKTTAITISIQTKDFANRIKAEAKNERILDKKEV